MAGRQVLRENDRKEIDILLNQSIKKVGEDIKNLKFNTAVSTLMILVNKFEEYRSKGYLIPNTKYEILLLLLAPFAPHITEELWTEVLKNKKSIHLQSWPKYDEALLAEEMIDLVLQVNGKLRDTIKVKKGLSEEEARSIAMSNKNVKKHLAGKEVKKFIYIKDRLTNLVI